MSFTRPPPSTPGSTDGDEDKHDLFTESDSSPQLPKEGSCCQKSGKVETTSISLADDKPHRGASALRMELMRERAALRKEQAEFARAQAEFGADLDAIVKQMDEMEVATNKELEAAKKLKEEAAVELEAVRAEKMEVEKLRLETMERGIGVKHVLRSLLDILNFNFPEEEDDEVSENQVSTQRNLNSLPSKP